MFLRVLIGFGVLDVLGWLWGDVWVLDGFGMFLRFWIKRFEIGFECFGIVHG